MTVVFDGKEVRHLLKTDGETSPIDKIDRREFFSSHAGGVANVVFSKGQSADDLIKKTIEQSTVKKSWVVVSDDKQIKFYVRALGANVLTVKEFTRGDSKKSKQSAAKNQALAAAGKYISLTQQAKINQELERIWMNPKS